MKNPEESVLHTFILRIICGTEGNHHSQREREDGLAIPSAATRRRQITHHQVRHRHTLNQTPRG